MVGGEDVAAGEVAREEVPPAWGVRRRRDRSGERGGRKSNVWGGGRREEEGLVGAGMFGVGKAIRLRREDGSRSGGGTEDCCM